MAAAPDFSDPRASLIEVMVALLDDERAGKYLISNQSLSILLTRFNGDIVKLRDDPRRLMATWRKGVKPFHERYFELLKMDPLIVAERGPFGEQREIPILTESKADALLALCPPPPDFP